MPHAAQSFVLRRVWCQNQCRGLLHSSLALMSILRTWTPQLWWCMTWEQVAVATSHKQIWARAVGSCEEPEGREAAAMRLPPAATARQVMMPVSCCCRHLHHMAVKQGCCLHTGFCRTCSAMLQLMAVSSRLDFSVMSMALQHASVSADGVCHCDYSYYQVIATID